MIDRKLVEDARISSQACLQACFPHEGIDVTTHHNGDEHWLETTVWNFILVPVVRERKLLKGNARVVAWDVSAEMHIPETRYADGSGDPEILEYSTVGEYKTLTTAVLAICSLICSQIVGNTATKLSEL